MGPSREPAPKPPIAPGVSTPGLGSACLNEDMILDEICSCIKHSSLQRYCGKNPGSDGIVTDMIKDDEDLVKQCLLWLFNCMPASHCPEHLPVCLSAAIHKSGDKSDLRNYRGI